MKSLAIGALILVAVLVAQRRDHPDWTHNEQETINRSFNVSSASNAKKVLVDNINGYIHVTGYDGSEVRMTAQKRIRAESNEALEEAKRDVKLDISQQGNFVRIYVDGPFRSHDRGDRYYGYAVMFDYDIQAPAGTELVLSTVNHGEVNVTGMTGDYELRNVNGGIALEQVSGSGMVNTVNGPVSAHFSRNPAKPASFRTVNGQMDFYFQPGLDADLRFKTVNGGIYTDFDVTGRLAPASAGEMRNGKFVYRHDHSVMGRTGKGGPELSFDTVNGSIRLRTLNK
jgi:hypothetical protein